MASDQLDANDKGRDLSVDAHRGIIGVGAADGSEKEVAILKDDGRLVHKRLKVAAKLIEGYAGLNSSSEIVFVDGDSFVHLLTGDDDVATNEAWRNGVDCSDSLDFCIAGVSLSDYPLDFISAARLLELGIVHMKLDGVVPIRKGRHCRRLHHSTRFLQEQRPVVMYGWGQHLRRPALAAAVVGKYGVPKVGS